MILLLVVIVLAACGPQTTTKRVIDKRIEQQWTRLATPAALTLTRYFLTIQQCPVDPEAGRCRTYEIEVNRREWERTAVEGLR